MYTTDMYEGMIAETITVRSKGGDVINAYLARPLGPGPFPGMVLAHHMPGWDEWYRETTRKFAHHGYVTFPPTCITGRGTVRPTTWPQECAPRVVSPTIRRWAICRRRWNIFAHFPTPTGRSAASELAPAGVTSCLRRRRSKDSTPWSTAGVGESSCRNPTLPRRYSRRPSTTRPAYPVRCWDCSARRTAAPP